MDESAVKTEPTKINKPRKARREINISLDKLFGRATTITFVSEIMAMVVLIGGLVAYALNFFGLVSWFIAAPDIAVFALLIGGGIAFLIFLLFIGFFIKFHDDVQGFVIGKGIGQVDSASGTAKTILIFFGASVTLLTIAGIYGYYLIWKLYLTPLWVDSLSLQVTFIALGWLIASFLAQLATALVGRYAGRLISQLTKK